MIIVMIIVVVEFQSGKNADFEQDDIRIFLCKNELKYVEFSGRDEIFDQFHNSPIGGHCGIKKCLRKIREKFYWEDMKTDITHRIRRCLKCQLKKYRRDPAKNPMLITDTPSAPMVKIAMDVCGPFEKTDNDNVYVLTIQCLFSKYMVMIPMPDATAETIAKFLVKRFICIHGCPEIILTDLGTNFVSKLFREVAKLFSIKRTFTTAYRPQSNGSIERAHTKLNEFLRFYSSQQKQWDEWVEFASFCYNTTVHDSTNYTPHELVFAKKARFPSDGLTLKDQTYLQYVTDMITRLTEIQNYAYK